MPQIQVRRGTTAQWTAANPILAAGEPGYDTTLEVFKIGNGTDRWLTLPVGEGMSEADADARYAPAELAADVAGKLSLATTVASVGRGGGLFKDDPKTWFTDDAGNSFTTGNRKNSVGFAGQPTAAPATTVGTGGVTFPLSNSVVPVADCAALNPLGGSFKIGGQIVVYTGRSATSGPGNATGCYTKAGATGTVAAGTALGFEQIGWGPSRIYHVFGDDGVPVPGSTQAFFGIGRYQAPTVNDSAEAGSFACIVDGTFTQHRPVTGWECIAQITTGVDMPAGYGGPLLASGSRTNVGTGARTAQAIGHKLSHNSDTSGGYTDAYDGLYQSASAYEFYALINGAVTAGSNVTIAFDGATKRPPTPTAASPGRVMVGGNADGVGGQLVTYTGITGAGATGTLTGCSVPANLADDARISNRAYGVNVKDHIVGASGLGLGATAYSGSLAVALRGNEDSVRSMFSLTGPSNAEIAGGLTVMRINAGVGQTRQLFQVYDAGGSNRLSVTSAGALITNGQQIIAQTSAGVGVVALNGALGSLRLGTILGGLATSMFSGVGVPSIAGAVGDVYIRTDGGDGTWIYRCTTAGAAGAAVWTAKL